MKFRKKPVEIEAVQLRWDNWGEMCDHAHVGHLYRGRPQGCYVDHDGNATDRFPGPDAKLGLRIPTLEGVMLAVEGDWVIRGAQGELYPCKPAPFADTFEAVQ